MNGRCEAELKKLVEQEPRQAGYNFSTWVSSDLVRELVKKGFEKVSCETIRVHLHTLGYRVLRPVISIASPDPDYQKKVKKLDEYKKQCIGQQKLDNRVLYRDESKTVLLSTDDSAAAETAL